MAETNLTVDKVSPWSAMCITAVIGFIGFLAWLAAAGLLYFLLPGMGLFAPIGETVGGEDSISAGLVLGLAVTVGALWWVLSIGFMALGAVTYNACSGLVEGLETSLADDSQAVQLPADLGAIPVWWRQGRAGLEVFSAIWSWGSHNSYLMTAFNRIFRLLTR